MSRATLGFSAMQTFNGASCRAKLPIEVVRDVLCGEINLKQIGLRVRIDQERILIKQKMDMIVYLKSTLLMLAVMVLLLPACNSDEEGGDSDGDGIFTEVACSEISPNTSPFLDCTGIETIAILEGDVDNCRWLVSSEDLLDDVFVFYNAYVFINNTVAVAEANFDGLLGHSLADSGSESATNIDLGDEAVFVSYTIEGAQFYRVAVRKSNATIRLESIPVTDQESPCTEQQSVMIAFVEEILSNLE